jgi:hypothetical protein
MTIEANEPRNYYVGNGATEVFSFDFLILDDDDIGVQVRETSTGEKFDLEIGTDYSVSGVGDSDGGTVTLVDDGQEWLDAEGDLKAGYEILLVRTMNYTQPTSIKNQGSYHARIHEAAFDRLSMQIQQLESKVKRAIQYDQFEEVDELDPTFPVLSPGAIPVMNDAGTKLIEGPTLEDLSGITSGVADIAALQALSGVSASSEDLGTFTGGTIPDGCTVKEALQELETAVEGAVAGGSEFADDIFRVQDNADPTKEIAFQASGITAGQTRTITMPDANVNLGDIATLQSDLNVAESDIDTLQSDLDAAEVDIADLQTLTGVAANATDLGTFTGSTIPDGSDIKEALQALETEVESVSGSDISDLETLTGAGAGATDMGSFSGGTIPDGSDIKEALQALETAVESAGGGSPVYFSPVVHRYGAGSGTYDLPYAFTITSGSATVGATYTNNSVTFTVWRTVSGATLVYMTGSGAPASSGTLTKASGTGDATLTFSAYKKPIYLEVELAGGGGGGAGATSPAGSDGNDSTFGSSLLTALKGAGGGLGNTGGLGGGWTVNSPAIDIGSTGGGDGEGPRGALAQGAGGTGGGNALAGGAPGGNGNGTNAAPAASDSGVGGGGGGGGASNSGQAGGGAGAVVRALIPDPSATYPYVVGAGGAKGTGGSVSSGSDGANGRLVVKAHFQ